MGPLWPPPLPSFSFVKYPRPLRVKAKQVLCINDVFPLFLHLRKKTKSEDSSLPSEVVDFYTYLTNGTVLKNGIQNGLSIFLLTIRRFLGNDNLAKTESAMPIWLCKFGNEKIGNANLVRPM